MNAPITSNEFEIHAPPDFGRARLDLLDAFFELEVAVSKWLLLLGECEQGAPLGQRLKTLSEHPNLEEHAKKGQVKFIRGLAQSCRESFRVRNAVVHSRCRHGQLNADEVIFFETVKMVLAGEGALIPMRLAEISEASKTARKVAGQLLNFISQNKIASTL